MIEIENTGKPVRMRKKSAPWLAGHSDIKWLKLNHIDSKISQLSPPMHKGSEPLDFFRLG